ncbi:MAG: HAD family hydrolase [Armatimonadota bacterium]
MEKLLRFVQAVLFDLDGTLVETNIDFLLMKRKTLALAQQVGVDTSALSNLDILGIIDTAENYLRISGSQSKARMFRSTAMAQLEQIEMQCAKMAKEIPGARKLVEKLRQQGIGIGVVTRNCRKASRLSLRITEIRPDVLICREDCNKHKPYPEPIFLALKKLQAEPSYSIMVGDHIMDIQSGKTAGLKTIGFLREDRPDDFFRSIRPDLVVRSLEEVMRAVIGDNS